MLERLGGDDGSAARGSVTILLGSGTGELAGTQAAARLWPPGRASSLAPTALMSALVVASISDLRTLRVPAWLSLATLLTGLAVSGVHGIAGIEAGLLGIVAGGLVLLPFVVKAGMGPADSLLLAGVGAWEGWRFALVEAFCTSIVGALLGHCTQAPGAGLRGGDRSRHLGCFRPASVRPVRAGRSVTSTAGMTPSWAYTNFLLLAEGALLSSAGVSVE